MFKYYMWFYFDAKRKRYRINADVFPASFERGKIMSMIYDQHIERDNEEMKYFNLHKVDKSEAILARALFDPLSAQHFLEQEEIIVKYEERSK